MLSLRLIWIVLQPGLIAGANGCAYVISIGEVLQSATRLDGKVVCIRGVIAVQMSSQREHSITHEITSLEDVRHGTSHSASGLIDWDRRTGVSSDLYKPDFFKLIEDHAKPGRTIFLDTTVRAEVIYKRRLLEKAREVAAHALGIDPFSGSQRDVELVLLEIIKVNRTLRESMVTAQE